MRSITYSKQFRKDYRLMERRGNNIEKLDEIIEKLANDVILSPEYDDHPLLGNKDNIRDCHVQNDWVLLYQKTGTDQLQLIRTGTHSDLFK